MKLFRKTVKKAPKAVESKNSYDDFSDMSPKEKKSIKFWKKAGRFNVNHFRAVKEARLSIN